MTNNEIKALIETAIESAEVTVSGEGGMFETTVISEQFAGMMPVKKQQMVYAAVNSEISNGNIHALTIKAYTPKEWELASKLKIG